MREKAQARGLSSSYLEGGGRYDDDDDDDDEGGVSLLAIKKQAKLAASRRKHRTTVGHAFESRPIRDVRLCSCLLG